MTMKLHCFGESGNAYKAALALELSGLDWTPVYVDFFNGAARTPEYRETINAMGEVPVLVDGDIRLSQSGVIQSYVTEKTGKFGGATACFVVRSADYHAAGFALWQNFLQRTTALGDPLGYRPRRWAAAAR